MPTEQQIAEVKALIIPLFTPQLEDTINTGILFGLKLEDWAIDIIKEELKSREGTVVPPTHGEDYLDVIRLIAEAKTIPQLDKIIGDIAERRYQLTPTDELELQTKAIEKRGKREEELAKVEDKTGGPPERKEKEEKEKKEPKKEREVGVTPEPYIEIDTCPTCGVAAPNLDFDTRSFLSQILGIPIHLFDACQRCVIGVYGYGDILTYITSAIENPRKFNLGRKDLEWLRKVERTIKTSEMAVMFAVDVETAFGLGAWLYKYYKGEVLSIGMSNVFVTHREEIIKAFGEEVANEPGAAKIASARLVGKWLGRQKLKTPKTAIDAVVNQLFPKFMLDWVEYGFAYVLDRHNITVCSVLSRFGFRVEPTGEMAFGRPKCTVSDEVRDLLVNSLINLTAEYEFEEVETRG